MGREVFLVDLLVESLLLELLLIGRSVSGGDHRDSLSVGAPGVLADVAGETQDVARLAAVDRDHIERSELVLAALRQEGDATSVRSPVDRRHADLSGDEGPRLAVREDHVQLAPRRPARLLQRLPWHADRVGDRPAVRGNLAGCDHPKLRDMLSREGLGGIEGAVTGSQHENEEALADVLHSRFDSLVVPTKI